MAQVAVISGGSSGIGLSFVAALHKAGWTVYASGRDPEKLARAAENFPGLNIFVCDVSDRAAVQAAAARVRAGAGKVDLLISNAGGLARVDFAAPDADKINFVPQLRDNLEGAINWISAFLPLLRIAPKGRIIITGSGYGIVPTMRSPIYSAAKAGLHMFAKALRYQLAPTGITVTEVLPPVVDTPAVAHRTGAKIAPEELVRKTLAASEAGREEVYLGQTRMLPLMLRLAPKLIEGIAAKM